MSRTILNMVAVAAIALMGTIPTYAEDLTPVGQWQTTSGESRYEVTNCGDGTQICAKLTWLRSDARTAENLAYLNKYVVRGAHQVADNKWRGIVSYSGQKVGGSVKLVNNSRMELNGCAFIMCQTVEFERI